MQSTWTEDDAYAGIEPSESMRDGVARADPALGTRER
jgi:hypothetical protein